MIARAWAPFTSLPHPHPTPLAQLFCMRGLTFKGISNLNVQKKERLITDEVARSQGGTIASRYSGLVMRQQACEKINKMFGLDIWCEFREDIDGLNNEDGTMEEGDPDE